MVCLFLLVFTFELNTFVYYSAWRPAYMDADQYLFVDLGSRYYVTSVATQGRRAAKEYVTVYNIMYSDNGHNWFYYTNEDKIIVVGFDFERVHSKRLISNNFRILLAIKMTMKSFEII